MNRYNLSFIILAVILSACSRSGHHQRNCYAANDTLAVITSYYNDDLYNQGHTSACWIYAMCACIEREQLRHGDSVTLSRQWLMSRLMAEQAIDYRLTHGGRNISIRGVGPEVLRLIHTYGLVPYNMERSHINNSNVMERKMRLLAMQGTSMTEFQKRMKDILPEFTIAYDSPDNERLGTSSTFYFYSMRYTPWQFAQSIMYDQQWAFFASEAIHPWHQPFALEVADNRRYHEYMNIPMTEMYNLTVQSLKAGHPVYWEYGKVAREKNGGMADSDHAMAIVAYIPSATSRTKEAHSSTNEARSSQKSGMFLCLNSYGRDWGDNGYCLVSKDFFLHHTCNIGLVRDATERR